MSVGRTEMNGTECDGMARSDRILDHFLHEGMCWTRYVLQCSPQESVSSSGRSSCRFGKPECKEDHDDEYRS